MVAARVVPLFAEEAKKRQGTRTDIQETVPESEPGQARDKAAAAIGGVSGRTVDNREERDATVFSLWLACHTEDEIAEKVGMSRDAVHRVLCETESFQFHTKSGFLREIEDDEKREDEIAERVGMSQTGIAKVLALNESFRLVLKPGLLREIEDDAERFDLIEAQNRPPGKVSRHAAK